MKGDRATHKGRAFRPRQASPAEVPLEALLKADLDAWIAAKEAIERAKSDFRTRGK